MKSFVALCVASLVAFVADTASAQCRGGQCSTPAAACTTGNCNLQATAIAPAAPVVAAPVAVAPTSSRAVAVTRTKVGGPLAGMKTRRAARAVDRANRANSKSRAVSRVRVSAVEAKHDILAAATSVPSLDEVQAVAVAPAVTVQPAATAVATAGFATASSVVP